MRPEFLGVGDFWLCHYLCTNALYVIRYINITNGYTLGNGLFEWNLTSRLAEISGLFLGVGFFGSQKLLARLGIGIYLTISLFSLIAGFFAEIMPPNFMNYYAEGGQTKILVHDSSIKQIATNTASASTENISQNSSTIPAPNPVNSQTETVQSSPVQPITTLEPIETNQPDEAQSTNIEPVPVEKESLPVENAISETLPSSVNVEQSTVTQQIPEKSTTDSNSEPNTTTVKDNVVAAVEEPVQTKDTPNHVAEVAIASSSFYVCGLDPNGDNFLSLRDSSHHLEILRMTSNTPVTILDSKGKWYQVQLTDGTIGWAAKHFICQQDKFTNASPITQIKFAKGAYSAIWSGVISDGNKKFKLSLGKGQMLKVGGDDVYTWTAIAPNGEELGCNGGSYCVPDAEIQSLLLSGEYIISTDYRMSSCATCPSDKTRNVQVSFEAR